MSAADFEVTGGGRVIYSVKVAARARTLHAAEWPVARIAKLLADEFGLPKPPSSTAVYGWVDPKFNEKRKQRERERLRGKSYTFSVVQNGHRSPEWKMARMRVLRGAGLSFNAVAKVMAVDFPGARTLTEDEVRHALLSDRAPKVLRWAA